MYDAKHVRDEFYPEGEIPFAILWAICWTYCDVLLGILWRYAGDVMAAYWQVRGDMLAILWRSVGDVVVISWRYCGDLLPILWRSEDGNVAICWRSAGDVVVLLGQFACCSFQRKKEKGQTTLGPTLDRRSKLAILDAPYTYSKVWSARGNLSSKRILFAFP